MPIFEALLQHQSHQWKPWLEENLKRRELIVLDPGSGVFHARCILSRNLDEQVIDWRFLGSAEATMAPLSLIRGAKSLIDAANRDAVVLLPNYKSTPVLQEIYETLFSIIQPSRLFLPKGINPARNGWPPCDEVPVSAPIEIVLTAQRRARWIEFQEDQESHEILLHTVHFSGGRLGLGEKLSLDSANFPAETVWAEINGDTLFAITENLSNPDNFVPAMKKLGLKKIHLALSSDYEGLLIGLYRHQSEPIAMGTIERTDFRSGKIWMRTKVAPGTTIARVQLGLMRLDNLGKELGELRPWSI